MKELFKILETYDALQHAPVKLALATVVKVRHATQPQPGVRMLMTGEGRMIGSIGGGSLDGDVLEKATLQVMNGKAQLAVYDLVSDVHARKPGHERDGIVYLLVEPVTHPQGALQFRFLHDCLHWHKTGVMATVFRVEGEIKVNVGARVTLSEDATVTEDVKDPLLTSALLEDCREVLAAGLSANKEYRITHGSVEAFIEFIGKPIQS